MQVRLTGMNKKLLLVLLVLLLVACNFLTPTLPTPTLTPLPGPSPTPSNKTGMVARGQVTVNGVALAGVKIYKRFNAYPRELIAITDENGYYESEFIGIHGDEMTSIEAELAGYTFDPPYYYWRHYYGYETTTCNFAATPTP